MFCPVCKYEFRRGFTHCNQCDVDLVDSLSPEPELDHTAATPENTLDHPVLLWSGANAGIFSALTSALDTAEIPYNKEDLDARLVFTSQHGDLEIWIPAANLAQAQPILDGVLANPLNSTAAQDHYVIGEDEDGDPNDVNELPDESDEGADDLRTENVTRELYPEDATAEVWSGADSATAEMLKTCLAEIGIACYLQQPGEEDESAADSDSHRSLSNEGAAGDSSASALFAIRVLPEDESRAAEIVRQVTDAAPPE